MAEDQTPAEPPKKMWGGDRGKNGRSFDGKGYRDPKVLFREGEERRRRFLECLASGLTQDEALSAVGVTYSTYRSWRTRDREFAAEADSARSGAMRFRDEESWESFAEFRQLYFRHHTPPHQALIINALESAKPGDIRLVLVPPEHGKTTLFEDFACYKLGSNPEYRITVGTEAQKLARRIIGRVKNRMELDGPFPKYAKTFGPFTPQKDNRSTRQAWAADYFNVYKRRALDERDYSMVGIGFGSNIAGSRTDHLHGDDLQSMKTLSQTEKMMDTFRQDWLSRPGENGITTVNGTRVGDGDIYEKMMEAWDGDPLFQVVRLPAIVKDHMTGEERPLWPYDPHTKTGYTMEMLERIHTKVGPDAWSRNYMQLPRARSLGTFTEDMIDQCRNYGRRLGVLPVENAPIYIGLDPAIGGINCLMGIQVTSDKLYILDVVEDQNLAQNEQIMARLEALVVKYRALGGAVTDVVIESMNFQRGLARDERLRELSERHGFALREHLTGTNKYDPDIGVPSMVSSFLRREVDIAYDADTHTRDVADQLRDQLLRWRPGIKGAVLRQDQVMALWFVWIVWQSRRKMHLASSADIQMHGLPWKPMDTGLFVPATGRSPFYQGA